MSGSLSILRGAKLLSYTSQTLCCSFLFLLTVGLGRKTLCDCFIILNAPLTDPNLYRKEESFTVLNAKFWIYEA